MKFMTWTALAVGSVLSASGVSAQPYYPDNYGIDRTHTNSIVPRHYTPEAYGAPPDAYSAAAISKAHAKEMVASIQIIMMRAGVSSGVIDGVVGSNYTKAVEVFGQMTSRYIDPSNEQSVAVSLKAGGGPAFKNYVITQEDVGWFYVAEIPSDYAKKSMLPSLAFTSVREMLAERFHIDEGYLQELNPGVDFNRIGAVVKVPNLLLPKRRKIYYIIANKERKQVLGYGEDGNLEVVYPATIGSTDTPSPSGTVEVTRVAINPNYTYNPKINFKQGNNNSILILPPGPNGPVGIVWIALSKPTYGIHGTPDPSRIGKTSSHGCVRLTNWDANELAHLVSAGAIVHFQD